MAVGPNPDPLGLNTVTTESVTTAHNTADQVAPSMPSTSDMYGAGVQVSQLGDTE